MLLMEHGIGGHGSTPDLFEINENALFIEEGKVMEAWI
jgi:restriction system protein